MHHVLRCLGTGTIVVLGQWLFFGRLTMWGAYPDLSVIFIVWAGLRYHRMAGATGGFLVGLAMDVLYGTWGIQMFAKTLLGFLAGGFRGVERELLLYFPRRTFVFMVLAALVHNGLLVVLVALQTGSRMASLIFTLWLGGALYTGVLGMLVSLFSGRLRRR